MMVYCGTTVENDFDDELERNDISMLDFSIKSSAYLLPLKELL
jgi:hypothetical protein